MSKRKHDQSSNAKGSSESTPTCILHVLSISEHGPFTPLSKIKGNVIDKLDQLHKIRYRRLQLPNDSSYRMQSVCDQIPITLPNNLDSVGYHRQCYQRFTGNLYRLGGETESEASTSQWHHSPRKMSSASSTGPIFPPECIFCEKEEIKSGGKTERTEDFSSWRKKENAWQQIETRAEKMGLDRLYRLVKNQDLFAVEAKYHRSCMKSFRTAFANYERGSERAEKANDTDYARMSAAHDKAFISVVDHIQTHVVQQHQV